MMCTGIQGMVCRSTGTKCICKNLEAQSEESHNPARLYAQSTMVDRQNKSIHYIKNVSYDNASLPYPRHTTGRNNQ